MAFSIGGESGSTKTSSSGFGYNIGENYSQGGTYLDPYQQGAQQDYQGRFLNALPGLGGGQAVNQGMQYAQGRMNDFIGSNNPYINNLRGNAQYGMNQLGQFANSQNPYLQDQISQFGQDVGRNFNEQILPGIGSEAQLMGQRGSSRQGVAEGLAAQGAQDIYARGVTDIYNNAYNQQLNAAGQLANIGTQGAIGAAGQNLDAYGQVNQLVPAWWQAGQQARMAPFEIGSSIFGAPTALNYNQSYGYDLGYDENQSKSKQSSQGLDIGF